MGRNHAFTAEVTHFWKHVVAGTFNGVPESEIIRRRRHFIARMMRALGSDRGWADKTASASQRDWLSKSQRGFRVNEGC